MKKQTRNDKESGKSRQGEIELNIPEEGNKSGVYRIPVKDIKGLFRRTTGFVIRYMPHKTRTWQELGTTARSKVVNELAPDYIPPKGRCGRPVKYKIINDEILEVDTTETHWFIFGFSLLACLWLIWGLIDMYYISDFGKLEWYDSIILFMFSSVILTFSYFVIRRLYCPVYILRFNRLKGTVEMPKARFKGWRGETKIIPFREMILRYSGTMVRNLSIMYPEDRFFVRPLGLDEHNGLPFVIWFMDRNRPLPPGEIFDIYRLRDYERRKSEGFRPPLFPASINDKELTSQERPDIRKLKLIKRIGTKEGVRTVEVEPEE